MSRSALAVMLCLLAQWTEGLAERSNVVLFLVDDLGWMDLGCQGSHYYKTPHIDRLAASGIRFTNAYAACAVCTPTRASILTGKYPARNLMTQWLPAGRWSATGHRMREGRFLRSLPLEEVTLAEALREAGYRTLHVGKWHLGGPPFSLPSHHGFDVNVGGSEHGAPGHYFYPYKGSWKIPTTEQRVQKITLPDGKKGEYLTDRLTSEALKLIEESRDQPFFLYFPYYAVHTPLQGKKELISRFSSIPRDERQGNPVYAAMVASVDESVGRVVKKLEELNLDKDTLVIFTSDNGGFAGATKHDPLRANKGSHYEGGIRVPLIVAGAGVKGREQTSSVPTISNDIYPTVLEMMGLSSRPYQHVDGVSLVPVIKGSGKVRRDALFWHYPHYNRPPQSAPVSIVRQGKWKLIEFLERSEFELYDLEKDPGEKANRAADYQNLVSEMNTRLQKWKKEVGAQAMESNPQYTGK